MTAHQTFDEWFYGKGYAKDESGFAREIWNAAMENAARICEAVNRTTGECPELATYCAEAIREAAKQ